MKETIPPLSPGELNKHHFGDTEWKMDFGASHHLFHINKLEGIVDKINFPLPPHRKTVFDFIFLTEGSTSRSKGLQEYIINKNTFFFLPAFQISSHKYVSRDIQGYFCHFDAQIFDKLFAHKNIIADFHFLHFLGSPTMEIDEKMKQPILNLLSRMEQEYYRSSDSFNIDLIIAYLLALFSELNTVKKIYDDSPKNAALRITEKYKNLLSQHIYQTNKVADFASMLAITPDHLNKCVKATIGRTSQELLAEMIVLEAKVMLKQTNLSISEIAFKFSETNPSDFTRFFKSKTGVSPKEFRKNVIS